MRWPGLLARTRSSARAPLFSSIFLGVVATVGCATGSSGTQGLGGTGGDTTTGMGANAGSAGTAGADGGSGTTSATGGADTGGMGGMTTTTTSSTTTTTTSTGVVCTDPEDVAGYGPESEPNALAALATPLADGMQGFSAFICPPADIDVFAIPVVTEGASLRLEIKGPGGGCPPFAATYLRLFDSNDVLIASDTDSGNGSCSLIAPQDESAVLSLPAGTYYAQVENLGFTVVGPYVLEVLEQAPGCGDGLLQAAAGEQCDDGNLISGDGCTADCLVEAVCGDGVTHFVAGEECDDGNVAAGDGCAATCLLEANFLHETEPNTQDMPNSLVGNDGAIGSIKPIGDADWYSFEVQTPGSSVVIATSEWAGRLPCRSGHEGLAPHGGGRVAR